MVWIIWLLCAIGGGLIYQSKNRPFGKGFLWGLLLGIIGVIVTLCKSKIETEIEKRQTKSESVLISEVVSKEVTSREKTIEPVSRNKDYAIVIHSTLDKRNESSNGCWIALAIISRYIRPIIHIRPNSI